MTDTQNPTTTTILTWATELATELESALGFNRPVSSIVVVEVAEPKHPRSLHYLAILDGAYSWLACVDQCQDWLEDYRQWEPEDHFTEDDRADGHDEYSNFCDQVDHVEDTDVLLAASAELGIPLNGWMGNIDATTDDWRLTDQIDYTSRRARELSEITCEICGDLCSRCATADQVARVRRWAKRWSERAAEGYVRLEVARLYGRRSENVLLTRHTLRCQANGFWAGWLAGRS